MSAFGIVPADKFNIHDINVQHTGTFTSGGQWQAQTIVKYWVGTNGPFQAVFAPGEDTADNIKAAMNKQVQLLQAIGA